MWRILHVLSLAAVLSMLHGCGGPSAPPPAKASSAGPREQLSRLVAEYWDEYRARAHADEEDISPQFLADSLALERRYLGALLALPRPPQDFESQLTYELFRRGRELAIEGFTYPSELLPVDPFDSMPLKFARAGAGAGAPAVSSAADFELWQARADAYSRWTAQGIANMRDGARRGYTVPRVLVEEMLAPLAALGTDGAGNGFRESAARIPASIPEDLRNRIRNGMDRAINEKILPSYRELHDFLQNEYLPRARTSVGISALPLGNAWYAYLIRRQTGTRMTPAEIRSLGEAEVERVHARMGTVLAEAGYAGNAQGYLESLRHDPRLALETAEQIMSYYAALKDEVAAALPSVFPQAPAADVAMRPAEDFEAAPAPSLSYRDADPGGQSGGELIVNVAADRAQPRLADAPGFLREALPGQLYQRSIQRARADLPSFRRFADDPAFTAGWDLYAASLGEELGVYRETAPRFMALLGQLHCAAGLVIDAGLHAQGLSRQQAIDYLRSKLPIDEAEARATVDRDIALPGQALACTIGERKIRALRASAEQALGARFDVRAFHGEVLNDGAIPLDLLESKIKYWIDGPH